VSWLFDLTGRRYHLAITPGNASIERIDGITRLLERTILGVGATGSAPYTVAVRYVHSLRRSLSDRYGHRKLGTPMGIQHGGDLCHCVSVL